MPFNFELEDLLDFHEENDDTGIPGPTAMSAVLREHGNQDSGKLLKTTAAGEGYSELQFSTQNMGQLMMGMPIYKDQNTAAKQQEYLMSGLLGDTLQREETEGKLGGNFDPQVPRDVRVLADIKILERQAKEGGSGFYKDPNLNTGSGDPGTDNNGAGTGAPSGQGVPIGGIVDICVKQAHDTYVWGSRPPSSDPDPTQFDCSGLIGWACSRFNITIPRVTNEICTALKRANLLTDPENALKIRGALLFHFSSSPFDGNRPASSHVAMSLGDGTSIEARNRKLGVGIFNATKNRKWTHAGFLPGCDYGAGGLTDAEKWYRDAAPKGSGGDSGGGGATSNTPVVVGSSEDGGSTRTTGHPKSDNGSSSFHLTWLGLDEMVIVEASVTVEVIVRPTAHELYFWAMDTSFADSHDTVTGGAHIGLQWCPPGGVIDALNWGGYHAGRGQGQGGQSSVLDSTPSPTLVPIGREFMTGNTFKYPWSPNKKYTYTVKKGSHSGYWAGYINGLLIHEVIGGGTRLNSFSVWTECFAKAEASSSRVRWSNFKVKDSNGRTHTPAQVYLTYQSVANGGVTNTSTIKIGPGTFHQTTHTPRKYHTGTVFSYP